LLHFEQLLVLLHPNKIKKINKIAGINIEQQLLYGCIRAGYFAVKIHVIIHMIYFGI
jgi:hypothetical protein